MSTVHFKLMSTKSSYTANNAQLSNSSASTEMQVSAPVFKSDIEDILYGCGDSWPADKGVISLLDTLVIDYIKNITLQALDIAEIKKKLDTECFLFLIRKEKEKYNRVLTLLKTNHELKIVKTIAECDISNIDDIMRVNDLKDADGPIS